MTDARERVLEHLLTHSVRRGDFTLKSGRKSSWFIDSKQTICAPESMLDVASLVLERVPAAATAIGGLTMGADGVTFITAGVAASRGQALRAFSVRKEVKDHGAGGRIAGSLLPGDKVGHHGGHRHSWHKLARGCQGGARLRRRGDPAARGRRPRRDGGGHGRG